jgi:hypothetical protein
MDQSRRVFNLEIYRGLDGWVRMNHEMREVWAGWRVTTERIIDVGDRVVSIATVAVAAGVAELRLSSGPRRSGRS